MPAALRWKYAQTFLPFDRLWNIRRPKDNSLTLQTAGQARAKPFAPLLATCVPACSWFEVLWQLCFARTGRCCSGQKCKFWSARLLTSVSCLYAGRGGRHSPPASSAGPGTSWTQDEFVDKCSRMVDQIRRNLGNNAPIFDRPVDPKLVPDYYAVIRKPMDLGTLKTKLHRGDYSTPQQFAEVCVGTVCLYVSDQLWSLCLVTAHCLFKAGISISCGCFAQSSQSLQPSLLLCCNLVNNWLYGRLLSCFDNLFFFIAGHATDLDQLSSLQQKGDTNRQSRQAG